MGEFPVLEGQPAKRKRKRRDRVRENSSKLKSAKNRPVKPSFIIDGKDSSIELEDIWKIVSAKTQHPKLDGCKKTIDGYFVLTCSDKTTADAIRFIGGDLTIREQGPRKPRVKLKGIPSEYTDDFIAETIIKQNQNAMVDCNKEDLRPLFKCGKRNDFNNDWVIEVSPKAYRCLNGKRIFIGMVSTFPRPYIMASHC